MSSFRRIRKDFVAALFLILFILSGLTALYLYGQTIKLKSELESTSSQTPENTFQSEPQGSFALLDGVDMSKDFQSITCSWSSDESAFSVSERLSLNPLRKIKAKIDTRLEGETLFYICLNENQDKAAFFTRTNNPQIKAREINLKLYDVGSQEIKMIKTFYIGIPSESCLSISNWSKSNDLYYSCSPYEGVEDPFRTLFKVRLDNL